MANNTMLDQYLYRFQNLPSWNIYAVLPNGEEAVPWMEVTGEAIAKELIFDELNVMPQVDTVAANVQKWGRLESQAKRVWDIAARDLLRWKSEFMLNIYDSDEKTPAKHIIESKYRTHKDYHRLNIEVERAEEAYSATHMVLEAFRAKKDIITRFAKRYRDG